jgi:hypothetical protein
VSDLSFLANALKAFDSFVGFSQGQAGLTFWAPVLRAVTAVCFPLHSLFPPLAPPNVCRTSTLFVTPAGVVVRKRPVKIPS